MRGKLILCIYYEYQNIYNINSSVNKTNLRLEIYEEVMLMHNLN